MTGFFLIWFLVTTSDAIGAGLAVILLYRLGSRYGRFQALVFATLAFEAALAAFSLLLYWPQEAAVAPEFAVIRAAGRSVKSVGVWVYVFYLFNLCGRKREGLKEERD